MGMLGICVSFVGSTWERGRLARIHSSCRKSALAGACRRKVAHWAAYQTDTASYAGVFVVSKSRDVIDSLVEECPMAICGGDILRFIEGIGEG